MAVAISDLLLDCSDRLLETEPDEHLVRLAQSGHEAAFAAIVRRYEPELLTRARRLGSDSRAEDAVQQVFLNAFAALRSGSEVRHLRGWLHQILRNAVIRAQVPIDAPLDAASAHGEPLEEIVERRARAHATLVELSALPRRQRDALLGTAVMGFPRSLVAQRMGLSEGAVRQLVHRARLRLRQAATALVPFPLGSLFRAAGAGSGATSSEAVLGAGAAASGGMAIKVGTLLASGAVATGLAVTHGLRDHHHHPGAGSAPQHQLAQSPAYARGAQRLTEAPAIRPVALLAATGPNAGTMAVHGRATGRRGVPSSSLPGRLHETGASGLGPGRGRDNGRGHDSGAPGEQSTSPPGRGGDTGTRGSAGTNGGGHGSAGTNDGPGHSGGTDGGPSRSGGDQGERTGSGSASPSGHSGSASDAKSSSPSGGSGSGHDSGGSTNGNAQRSSGSDPSTVRTVTGDTATSKASGSGGSTSGSDGSTSGPGGSTGSSGASTGSSGTSNGPTSTSAPSTSGGSGGSGSDGSAKSFARSRDVSGSVDSSSS